MFPKESWSNSKFGNVGWLKKIRLTCAFELLVKMTCTPSILGICSIAAVLLLISNSEKRMWSHRNLDIPADLLEGAENYCIYLEMLVCNTFQSPLFSKNSEFLLGRKS